MRPWEVDEIKSEWPAGYGKGRTVTHPPREEEMRLEWIAAAHIQESALGAVLIPIN